MKSMFAVGVTGVLLVCLGCTTVKTTLWSSDGCCPERVPKRLKGTPTTLPVASHIQLIVKEKRYLDKKQGKLITVAKRNAGPDEKPEVVRDRELKYELIQKPEIFTVDVKRPAAGLIDYKIAYQSAATGDDLAKFPNRQQELQEITTLSYDETIVKSTNLLDSLIRATKLKNFGTGATLTDGGTDAKNPDIQEIETEIANEIFDLHNPDIHRRLQSFVEAYFNDCLPPCHGPAHFQSPVFHSCTDGSCGRHGCGHKPGPKPHQLPRVK